MGMESAQSADTGPVHSGQSVGAKLVHDSQVHSGHKFGATKNLGPHIENLKAISCDVTNLLQMAVSTKLQSNFQCVTVAVEKGSHAHVGKGSNQSIGIGDLIRLHSMAVGEHSRLLIATAASGCHSKISNNSKRTALIQPASRRRCSSCSPSAAQGDTALQRQALAP